MNTRLMDAVSEVLADLPCSERRLAVDAGLAPSTLSRIRSGNRNATIETVEKLAAALAAWAERAAAAESILRRALEEESNDE